MVNRLIHTIRWLLTRIHLVHRRRSAIDRQSLLPLVAMLPLVVYAWTTQSLVTSRTELRERDVILDSTRIMAHGLARAQKADAATCRDYSNWDDTYEQVLRKDPVWLKTNLQSGLVTSFKFDVALLQSSSGDTVWQSGVTPAVAESIRRYGVLRECAAGGKTRGILVLGNSVYSCCAVPVLKSDHTGPSRGMLLVGRLMRPSFLAELRAGMDDRVALWRGPSHVPPMVDLGRTESQVVGIGPLAGFPGGITQRAAKRSLDGTVAYGVLPVCDIRGYPVGLLADASSRMGVLHTTAAIKHLSLFLVLLCGFVGIAGVSYLRNRSLALRANHDELTGLYNHGYFRDRLRDLADLATRYQHSMSVLMVDIDHFKFVNDTHGHAVGDRVLKQLADTMVSAFRSTDVVARYGGEEFVVALPETDVGEAMRVAERLREAVHGVTVASRTTHGIARHSIEIKFTVSIGVAAYPQDAASPADAISAADAALAEAKRTRDCAFAYGHIAAGCCGGTSNSLEALDGFFRDSSISTIRPLIAAMDTRKPGSLHHSDKTAEYAVAMAKDLGLSTQDLALTCKTALLHDVGEIGIPDQLLTKPGSLTADELEALKKHSEAGAQILSQSPHLQAAAGLVLHHHERFDGLGYPDGMSGSDIPLIARIIAVADALDAMTSPRHYQETKSLEQALDELRGQSGKQFDPVVVEAAARMIGRMLSRPAEDLNAA